MRRSSHRIARSTSGPNDDPEHLDFVALSAHKMYAPFGTGVLVGRRDTFLQGVPEYQGGGTVDIVTATDVHWAGVPDRDEAGTPNIVGAIAMAAAARTLTDIGMADIEEHESTLTAYALERLQSVPHITIYGSADPADSDRLGVISFNLGPVHHALVAAILGYEGGIGVRSGCFCAQRYVMQLLEIDEPNRARLHHAHVSGDRSRRPGMVRISIGAYNTADDIDAAVEMLSRITGGDYRGVYCQLPENGDYRPSGYEEAIPRGF